MAEWIKFDPSLLYPDGVQDILDAADPLVTAFSAALDVMSAVVDVAGLFVQGMSDAQTALIQAVHDVIDAVVVQVLETGVFWTFHMPPSFSGLLSPQSWVNDVALSLGDYSDPNRPILPVKTFIGCICVAAAGPTYRGLLSDYRAMFDLFGKKIADAEQIDRWPERDDPWRVTPGVGRAPNWGSKRVSDIVPAMGVLAKKLIAFKDVVALSVEGNDAYSLFAQQLSDKSALLQGWASEIVAFLDLISALVNFEGAYVLPIYGEHDQDSLSAALSGSTGGLMDLEDAEYTSGASFLAVGAASADVLFDLFGLPKELTT